MSSVSSSASFANIIAFPCNQSIRPPTRFSTNPTDFIFRAGEARHPLRDRQEGCRENCEQGEAVRVRANEGLCSRFLFFH